MSDKEYQDLLKQAAAAEDVEQARAELTEKEKLLKEKEDELKKLTGERDKLAAEQGFMLIFDAADGNIVYGEKSLDLTDQVLTELNKDVEP